MVEEERIAAADDGLRRLGGSLEKPLRPRTKYKCQLSIRCGRGPIADDGRPCMDSIDVESGMWRKGIEWGEELVLRVFDKMRNTTAALTNVKFM